MYTQSLKVFFNTINSNHCRRVQEKKNYEKYEINYSIN